LNKGQTAMPSMPTQILRPWSWLRLAGLDTPLYALAWVALHAACYNLYIPPVHYVLLGGAILLVQMLDQALDLRNNSDTLRSAARKRLLPLYICAWLVLAPWMIWTALSEIPGTLLMAGVIVSLLTVLYLLHAQRLRSAADTILPKELFQAFLLALALALPTADALGQLNNLNANAWFRGWMESPLGTIAATLQWTILILSTQLSRPEIFFTAALFCIHRIGHSVTSAGPNNDPEPAAMIRFRPKVAQHLPLLTGLLALAALVWAIFPISGAHLVLRPYFYCLFAASMLLLIAHGSYRLGWTKPVTSQCVAALALLSPLVIVLLLR